MLTAQQIGFYREQGYLLVEDVFPEAELAELRRVTAGFVEAARAVPASDAVYDLAPGHGAERPLVRRVKNPERQHPAYAAAARGASFDPTPIQASHEEMT